MSYLRFTRHLLLLLASVSLLLLGACRDNQLITPPDNAECCAEIVVNVTIGRSTTPLAGVAVELRKGIDVVAVKETGENGKVTFADVCNAEYNVRLKKEGYSVAEREITIDSCGLTAVSIGMISGTAAGTGDSCCTSTLRIIPTDNAGNSVAGAQVKLTGPNGVVRVLESSLDGVLFRELCRGDYSIRIAREGFKVHESRMEIGCNVERTERRALVRNDAPNDSCCTARLVVNVNSPNSGADALNGATVKLWQGGRIIRTLTMNGRTVVFEELCEGSYGISVSKDGYKGVEAEVIVRCNTENVKTLELQRLEQQDCCNNIGVVKVLEANTRRQVNGAVVKLFKGGVIKATLRTNADGVARFPELCAGEYGVLIERDGYRPAEGRLNVICERGGEVTIDITPEGPGNDVCCTAVLRLRVLGSERDTWYEMAGVQVVIRKLGVEVADGTTNGDGLFARENLCGQSHYVIVLEKDGFRRMELELDTETCRLYEKEVRMIRN